MPSTMDWEPLNGARGLVGIPVDSSGVWVPGGGVAEIEGAGGVEGHGSCWSWMGTILVVLSVVSRSRLRRLLLSGLGCMRTRW